MHHNQFTVFAEMQVKFAHVRAEFYRAAKRALYLKTGALAVDMESHIVAGVAAAHGLPVAAIRVITDPALRAVPHDPDAWQLFTFADVLLMLLAVASAVAALGRSRVARRWLLAALAGAAAFVLHALAVPPTNGANIFDGARRAYAAPGASAGPGETVAILGLVVAAAGLALGRRRRPD